MTAAAVDPHAAAHRIEALMTELSGAVDPVTRMRVEELVRQLMSLYGSALARVMETAFEEDAAAASVLWQRLADDPLVGSLLALHELHPDDLPHRVARAIDRLGPVLAARGIAVSIVEVGGAAVRLRIDSGAPAALAALEDAIERGIGELAPEIDRIEFEGHSGTVPLLQITRPDGTTLGARSGERA